MARTAGTDVQTAQRAEEAASVFLGRGRAGVVYRRPGPRGPMAVKIFVGEPLSDLVNTLLTGAPNPYCWNGNAIRCALYRRRIVARLVRLWFGHRLGVADAIAVDWNPDVRGWELHAELVNGHPPALHQPFSTARDGEQQELVETIMRPLQEHLEEAGLDGLLWQAGRGNPVAASNFLVADRRRRARDGAEATTTRWSWIDLESGVPALFPADPRALFTCYLPAARRHGRFVFDDVDTERLLAYLRRHEEDIDGAQGAGTTLRLRRWTAALERHQSAWKHIGRLERSLQCALARRRIDSDEARRYRRHPGRWYGREAARLAMSGARAGSTMARRLVATLRAARPLRWGGDAWRFMTCSRVRERVGRFYVLRRIRHWTARGQLGRREAGWLRRETHRHDQATYLSDFAVHLAIKPVYKSVVWLALPVAAQAGLLPVWAVAIGMALAGAITRTLYTSARLVQAGMRRRPLPWMALWFGMLPMAGAAAFPMQLLIASRGRDGRLAGFLLYDTLGALGRRLPIWGGADTGAEHFTNRLGDRIVRERGPLLAVVRPEPQVRR